MIKLKSLIKEVGPTSSKDEETITIKHKTSEKEIVIVDTLKNRKKYTKMGYIIPLPKHLQKLIKDLEKKDREFKKYGVEVTDVIVPGLEWMNDIPEGVVKGEELLNEENESLWTWVYKGLLAGFKKAGKKGGNQLDDVAHAAAFLVKSEFGSGAKNDFIKTFKKWL